MKSLDYFFKTLLSILLLTIIAVGLINTETFYSPNSFAYYSFCIITLIFVIISSFSNSMKNNGVILKTPLLLFGLWCCYVLFCYYNNTSTPVFTIYCVTLYFLFLKVTSLFSKPKFNYILFFAGITLIALLESIYCIGQFLSFFKTQNKLFSVTGSWNNPNVIAIFLALTIPVFLFLFQSKFRKLALTGFIILLVTLLLLKCRAAFIGTMISIIIFYGLEYNFVSWIKNKKNRSSAIALFILSILIIIPLSSHLYNTKKASAEGRKFIWKLSAQMAIKKPLRGYGYGFFEKEYNLFQANYIKQGKATAEELGNAGPVIMPHNELLQNIVEGGVLGFLLLALFFGALLLAGEKREKEIATRDNNSVFNVGYSGIVAFIVMSMVNSTIQIVPIMCLFIIYSAIVCSVHERIIIPVNLSFIEINKGFSIIIKTIISSSSLYVLYLLIGMATADNLNKKAAFLKKERNHEQALQMMQDLAKNIDSYSDYWINYGAIYFETKEYSKALYCLEKAKKWSSLPEFYRGSGVCYEKLKQYPQAVIEYETLVALDPSKFSYRMDLLNIYLKNKETYKAIILADQIIQMKPKIPSEKVNQYKRMCLILLRKSGIQKVNNKQFSFKNHSHLNSK